MQSNLAVQIKLLDCGSIKAFADVILTIPELGEVSILGFRVVQKAGKDREPWVAPPSVSYEKNGERKNKRIVEMTPRLRALVFSQILADYRERSSAK